MMLDVIVIVDTRMQGSEARSFSACLRTLVDAGYRVGLIPVLGPLAKANGNATPSLQALLDQNENFCLIDRADGISCQLLFGYHIACFLHPINRRFYINAKTAVLRIDQPLTTVEGRTLVDLPALITNAEDLTDRELSLAPNDPIVRATLIKAGFSKRLTPQDWPPVVDLNLFDDDRKRLTWVGEDGRSFSLGRHDAERGNCWPMTDDGNAAMLAAGDWTFDFLDCGAFPGLGHASRQSGQRTDEAADFLHTLDAYITTNREGLHPYVDTALAEALRAGLPIIAPTAFAPLLGDAGLMVDEGDWQDTYGRLNEGALAKAGKAAEQAGQNYAPERLLNHLSRSVISPAQRSLQLTLKREQRSIAHILFITPNGIGMGHLTRMLAVARRLEAWLQPVFLTMSKGAGVIDDFGFTVEYVPYYKSYNGPEDSWQPGFKAKLEQMIGFYDPRVIIFDGNVPYQALLNVRKEHPERFFIWCRRSLWRQGTSRDIVERAKNFDLVIEPQDHADSYDRGPTVAKRDQVVRIAPMTLLDQAECETRAQARRNLGLPMDATAMLLMPGSGNNFEMGWMTKVIQKASRDREDLLVRRGRWMISYTSPEDRTLDIEGYPFARYFNAFDFAVSAVGYNSFHELLAARLPTIFVPNENPTMDDQAARALWAERSAIGYCIRARDELRLGWAVGQLLNPETRQAMRRHLEALPTDNGAKAFAEIIRDLALCRRADQASLDRAMTRSH